MFKKSLDTEELSKNIKQILDASKCRVEGVWFYKNFTKLKLPNIEERLNE